MKTMMRYVSFNNLIFVLALFAGHAGASDCDINVSQPHIDFGTFNRGTLSQATSGTQVNIIGQNISTLTVICPRPEHIAVFYRTAASHSAEGYPLGNLANVSLILSNAQADGKSTLLSYQQEGSSRISGHEKYLPLKPNMGVSPDNSEPVKTLVMQLTSIATVNDENVRVKEHNTLNSNGTLEVVSE